MGFRDARISLSCPSLVIKNPPILPEAGGCDILSPIPRSFGTWCHALVGVSAPAGALFVVLPSLPWYTGRRKGVKLWIF